MRTYTIQAFNKQKLLPAPVQYVLDSVHQGILTITIFKHDVDSPHVFMFSQLGGRGDYTITYNPWTGQECFSR